MLAVLNYQEIIDDIFTMIQSIYNNASKSVHQKTLNTHLLFDYQPDLHYAELVLVAALSLANFIKAKVATYYP